MIIDVFHHKNSFPKLTNRYFYYNLHSLFNLNQFSNFARLSGSREVRLWGWLKIQILAHTFYAWKVNENIFKYIFYLPTAFSNNYILFSIKWQVLTEHPVHATFSLCLLSRAMCGWYLNSSIQNNKPLSRFGVVLRIFGYFSFYHSPLAGLILSSLSLPLFLRVL